MTVYTGLVDEDTDTDIDIDPDDVPFPPLAGADDGDSYSTDPLD